MGSYYLFVPVVLKMKSIYQRLKPQWRVGLALVAMLIGVVVVLVSVWQSVQLQLEQEVTPPFAEVGVDGSTLDDLSPAAFGLPEPTNLPSSFGYYRETAWEWIALFREGDSLQAVNRRRELAELRLAAALTMAGDKDRTAAMEAAAKGVVYLSRAAENLVDLEPSDEVTTQWMQMHDSAERLHRALLALHAAMPIEWRSKVSGWIEQVRVVHGQAEERVGVREVTRMVVD